MGSWDSGLLDSDDALDAVSELAEEVFAELRADQAGAPDELSAARSAAMIGVLVQLGSSAFEEQSDVLQQIASRQVSAAKGETRRFLKSVADGHGAALAAKDGEREGDLLDALGAYLDHQRPSDAFASAAATGYLRELADRWAARIEDELKQLDPYRTSYAGLLAALAIVAPATVQRSRVDAWSSRVREAAARVDDDGDRQQLAATAEKFAKAARFVAA
jgi:hypothetical protein